MISMKKQQIVIKALGNQDEIHICAQMMAGSEPWITLKRDYQSAVDTLSDPVKEVYLAVSGDEITGYVIINMSGAFIGYIQTVCVSPAWRGNGIGTRLIQFAEDRILRETPNVFICVSSFNPQARKLYERLGYQIIGEMLDYTVSGHSEFLLRKTIGPLTEFNPEDE